ncbi:MAG: quinone-dependent dihydroorotate dehydrogenase [Gammaproteobacteria bacterium]|nr:quinone-dependent dihydroorotate dehydrogenase [Gammaproteobacteria bacterium]
MPNLYPLIRPLLFKFDPETAHGLTFFALELGGKLGLTQYTPDVKPVKVMGLEFPTPLGLAAGLDKNGTHINALAALGFGFLEIGTVTPRPQPGNPKPRLFRIPQAQAIINRMGFNNEGVDHLIANIKAAKFKGVLGINIGKNVDTPIEKAADDYLIGLRKVYPYASYVAVNISSPNTANLRELQQADQIGGLLEKLKQEQLILNKEHGRYVPIVVKIAPDMSEDEIEAVAKALLSYEMDGVIATNTTLSRSGVENMANGDEQGGLSGAPLTQNSTETVKQLYACVGDKLPIIAAGGIMNSTDAQTKLDAGAKLVQIYSGLIYKGPELVKEITENLHY